MAVGLNQTINSTVPVVVQSAGASDLFTQGVPAVAIKFWELISAPFAFPHMQWIIIPLLLTFLLAEFYFFRHPDEELGWNAALVNSLVLVFVAIDLTKTVFSTETPWEVLKLFVSSWSTGLNLNLFLTIIFIGGLGLALAVINYLHLLPRKVAYLISSHAPINFIAYVAIVVVYRQQAGEPFVLGISGVLAAGILFTILVAIIFGLQRAFGSKDLSMYKRA